MVAIVLLDNMIRDFECDKNYMYSILTKYVKSVPLTRKEFEDFVNKSDLNMTKVKIKNPDNPAILNMAYLITYSK